MCGVTGQVNLDGLDRDAIAPRLDRAVARLRARGPDANGTWFDRCAALGHTRLAIIDLSEAGAQPMTDDGLALVYNGEIYNHADLRRELETLGHRFRGQSDTEVLLKAWRQWGAAVLPRLNGMFAFALWDGRELILARDRFGKKPLLYASDGRQLTFASDLVALEHLEATQRPVDPAALRLFFALRYLPEPWSIAQGVRHLAPGHVARFSQDGLQVESWVSPSPAGPYADEAEAARDLADRFDAAVAARLVADVPVGAYLSGGVDSGLVTAAMVRHARDVRSFTVGFAGVPDYYEERPAARRVADHLGLDHSEIEVSPDDALAAIEPMFDGLDEPFADSSALPSYILARETRRHVTVALSGDGGDEVFGGYRMYQGEFWAGRYGALPGWLRRGLIEPMVGAMPDGKGSRLTDHARRLKRFVDHGAKPAIARRAGLARLLDEHELDALMAVPSEAPTVEQLFAIARRDAPADDPLTALLIGDQVLGLPGDMLAKVDRTSMAVSLEVRSPFLDPSVVASANAMPGPWKLKPGQGKAILKKAFSDWLPDDVFSLPKKGFELPIDRWLTGPLDDLTRRAIDRGRLERQGLIKPDLPARWYDDLNSGRRDTAWHLWAMISFAAWSERREAGWS